MDRISDSGSDCRCSGPYMAFKYPKRAFIHIILTLFFSHFAHSAHFLCIFVSHLFYGCFTEMGLFRPFPEIL